MITQTAFEGKTILLTGASSDSDIGLGIAQALAQCGARLILVGRRREELEKTRDLLANPAKHSVEPFDLYDMDAIPAWMARLAVAHGKLSGVVHSASVQGYSPVNTIKKQHFEGYFLLNVGAPMALARGLHQRGVAAENASMVLIGSSAGLRGMKGRALYASSKAALVGLTKSLALEFAKRRMRVNCIAPALIRGSKSDQQFAMLSEEQGKALEAIHPMGLGQPHNVADAVVFLLSDMASWVTGVVLPVDGGFVA